MKVDHSLQSASPYPAFQSLTWNAVYKLFQTLTIPALLMEEYLNFSSPIFLNRTNKSIWTVAQEVSLTAIPCNGDDKKLHPQIDVSRMSGKCSSYPAGKLPVSQNYHLHIDVPCSNCKFESKGILWHLFKAIIMKLTGDRLGKWLLVCWEFGTDGCACFLSTC